ncbi:MAG: LLM class flavin-dependent oxidoreductase [Deltaproteobacteria bacterium]|nr:LLM class flavin-dependent oxidoreductase [Deltaproteobacteria bacterium]
MENTNPLQVGVLADSSMLTGPHERRKAMLKRVADADLDYVFVADHISFYTGFGMDGLIQAATAAALEPTLGIHLGVYLLALRHPVPVARQIASLCESAPGRLVLGVGIGGEDRHEIEICGVDPSTRGRRTNECLEIVRGLLSGEPIDFSGEFFELHQALIRPAPDPAVPFLIGGRSDAAIRRTGRFGDGWLGVWCSPRRYAEVISQIKEHAQEANRKAVRWQHGLQIWVGIDSDRNSARARLAAQMESMYKIPFERFEKYSPYGSAEEVADFLRPYVAAGAQHLNLMAVTSSSEEAVERCAEIKARLLDS